MPGGVRAIGRRPFRELVFQPGDGEGGTSGTGDDVFVYHSGNDTIMDFTYGDKICLRGIDGVDQFSDLTITQGEGTFTINFSNGNSLIITTDETSLTASDFEILDLVNA